MERGEGKAHENSDSDVVAVQKWHRLWQLGEIDGVGEWKRIGPLKPFGSLGTDLVESLQNKSSACWPWSLRGRGMARAEELQI